MTGGHPPRPWPVLGRVCIVMMSAVGDAVHAKLERFTEHVVAIMRPVGEAFVRRCQQLDGMDSTLTDIQRGQAYFERALLDDVDPE